MHLGPGTFIPDPPAEDGCMGYFMGLIGLLIFFALVGSTCSGPSRPPVSQATPPSSGAAGGQRIEQPAKPQPRQVRVTRFLPLAQRTFQEVRPPRLAYYPQFSVVLWQGRQVRIPHQPTEHPYAYLCNMNGALNWCWPRPPQPQAYACTQNATGTPGWCWEEYEWQ